MIEKDRLDGADMVAIELRQFIKLRHLPDDELAHRMAKDIAEVRSMRKQFGKASTRLRDIGLDYRIRLLLGKHGISTIGQLMKRSNAQLLALPGLGQHRLTAIQETIQTYMENRL